MAPPTQKVRLSNVLYSVDIITSEMDATNSSIISKKGEIADFNHHLLIANNELLALQQQLVTQYIQATGIFPPS